MSRNIHINMMGRAALSLALTAITAGAVASPAFAAPNELVTPNWQQKVSTGQTLDEVDASADGRFVVFTSTAKDWNYLAQYNDQANVYLRDRATNQIRLISHGVGKTGTPAGGYGARISDDGRYIAYMASTDVAPGDANGRVDYVRYDTSAPGGDVQLVSRTLTNGPITKDFNTSDMDISGNGRYVVFDARAAEMGGKSAGTPKYPASENNQMFRRDVLTGVTIQLSRLGNVGQAGLSGPPAISADGKVVVWQSDANNLGPAGYKKWREGAPNTTVGTALSQVSDNGLLASTPAITADGASVLTDDVVPGTPKDAEYYPRSVIALDGDAPLASLFKPSPGNYLSVRQNIAWLFENQQQVENFVIHAKSVVVSTNGRFFATTDWPKKNGQDKPPLGLYRMVVGDRVTNKQYTIVRDGGNAAGGYVTSISDDGRLATFVSAQDDVVNGTGAFHKRQVYAHTLPAGWNVDPRDPDKPACSDGKDNDGDGKLDAEDPGCLTDGTYNPNDDDEGDAPPTTTNPTPSDPTPPSPPTDPTPPVTPTPPVAPTAPVLTPPVSPSGACGDGVDNDGDGKVDVKDPECHTDGNPNNPLSYDASRGEGAPTDCVRLTPLSAISSISRPERVPGGQVRWQGPKRGLLMLNQSKGATFKLRFQAGKGKRAASPQRLVSAVEFSYNGKKKVVDRRGPFVLALPRKEFLPGQRRVEAKVTFRSGKTKKLRSAVVARYCKPPTMLVTQNQKQARKWTGFALRFDSGGPKATAVTFGLPASLKSRLPKAKARLGTLKLRKGSKVLKTLSLRMPAKRGKGNKLTLAKSGALRVLWTRGRGSTVAVSGLPADVTGVWTTFKAKHRNPAKGTRMAYTAAVTDNQKAKIKLTRVTRVGKK